MGENLKTFEYKNNGVEYKFQGYSKKDIIELLEYVTKSKQDTNSNETFTARFNGTELATIETNPQQLNTGEPVKAITSLDRDLTRLPNNYDENGIPVENKLQATGLSCGFCNQSIMFRNNLYNYFYIQGKWYYSSLNDLRLEDALYGLIETKEDNEVTLVDDITRANILNDIYDDLVSYIETEEYNESIVEIGSKIDVFSGELKCPVCNHSDTVMELAMQYKVNELRENGHCIICNKDLKLSEYESKKCNCGRDIDWMNEE